MAYELTKKEDERRTVSVQPKKVGKPYATLEYKYNEKTVSVFLRDEIHNYYIIEVDGHRLNQKETFISNEFLDMFKDVPGWNFLLKKKNFPKNQTNIFGMKVQLIVDRKTKKYIRVKLTGNDENDVVKRATRFLEEVKKLIDEVPTKNIMWYNTSYC